MKTVRVYRLTNLSPSLFHRLKAAQMEAACVWNHCMETHKAGQNGPCPVARATGVGAGYQRSVRAQCAGCAADRACLPRQRRDHPHATPGTPRNAHQVPLAHQALLPCQVARPGRPQRKGARDIANGPGSPVTGTAACPARKCGGLHARLEPGFRATRLRRDFAGRSGSRRL